MGNLYQPGGRRNVEAKTSSYTVTDQDFGALFTTSGATAAIVFTLPAPGAYNGEWVEFMNTATAQQTMTVKTSASTARIVAFNDAAATSVAWSTSNQKIGSGCRMISDGSAWICMSIHAVGGAATSATQAAQAGVLTIA